jgi:hypothetical protein
MVVNKSNGKKEEYPITDYSQNNIIVDKRVNKSGQAKTPQNTQINNHLSNSSQLSNNSTVIVSELVTNGTNLFYDYGRTVYENKPVINSESIRNLRTQCQIKVNKLNQKKNLLDETDGEFYVLDDIIDLFKEAFSICHQYRNQDILDGETISKICVSYFRAYDQYKQLFSSKGWEL